MHRPFSQSQQRLLNQLSNSDTAPEGEVAATRRSQLAWAQSILPRLHSETGPEDTETAFAEWQASCNRFLTDDLTELLAGVGEEADAALAQGRPFHLTSQFCFRLMQWSDQELTLIEEDEEAASPDDPWPARVEFLYKTAESHLASLLQHLEALAAEAAIPAATEGVIEDKLG